MTVSCPRPEHTGARVTRNGRYGPDGRQRFKCQPTDGPGHTFSVLAPLPDELEPAPLKSFRYRARHIAQALFDIGRGATYRQAAIHVGARRGDGSINGQLVANWIALFAPVVTAEPAPIPWPSLVSIGAFSLRRNANRPDLLVQFATAAESALVNVRVTESCARGSWDGFFDRLDGAPAAVVLEKGSAAAVPELSRRSGPPLLISPQARVNDVPDVEAHIDTARSSAVFRRTRDGLFRRLAYRQAHFTNLDQLEHVVQLMKLDLNGAADVAVYEQRILAAGPPTPDRRRSAR